MEKFAKVRYIKNYIIKIKIVLMDVWHANLQFPANPVSMDTI